MNEIWKSIDGYEGLYEISNMGNVRSLGNDKTRKTKILKPGTSRGYLMVSLWKSGKHKLLKVHRLVASAFLENPQNLPDVNHKDENKQNNCVDNLEWCTREYNNNYGTRNKRAGEALRGKPLSEETKRKMSESQKLRWQNKKQV